MIDETGFLKKGRASAGVARQYSGTAGRIENCQIGVFLGYASTYGHTLLDRELYLPAAWIADRARCQQAGIPEDRAFATKPVLAQQMLERTFAAMVALAWVTGDSVYGDDHGLRSWLEQRGQAYVLAISRNEIVWNGHTQQSVAAILAQLPADGWTFLSAGIGSKGSRWYNWQRVALPDPEQADFSRWLLFRQSLSDADEVAGYVVFARATSSLAAQVRVAGERWTIEECIQTAKGEVGLDHYEVRNWTGWYRHVTLAMWAQAFLSVLRRETGAEPAPKKGRLKTNKPSSFADFKAHRGLQSD